MGKEFVIKEKVRIYDTDLQGIVHYSGYYRFFTDALEQFALEKIGDGFPIIDKKAMFVVVESNARYHKSAVLGDLLNVRITPELLSDKAIKFNFAIDRNGDEICDGFITQVLIDKKRWKAVQIPKSLKDKLG